MTEKFYLCGENKICITDSCSKGRELISPPSTSVPVKTYEHDPNHPLFIKNPNAWKINEPQWDERITEFKFIDGTEKTIKGRIELVRGCRDKQ